MKWGWGGQLICASRLCPVSWGLCRLPWVQWGSHGLPLEALSTAGPRPLALVSGPKAGVGGGAVSLGALLLPSALTSLPTYS